MEIRDLMRGGIFSATEESKRNPQPELCECGHSRAEHQGSICRSCMECLHMDEEGYDPDHRKVQCDCEGFRGTSKTVYDQKVT